MPCRAVTSLLYRRASSAQPLRSHRVYSEKARRRMSAPRSSMRASRAPAAAMPSTDVALARASGLGAYEHVGLAEDAVGPAFLLEPVRAEVGIKLHDTHLSPNSGELANQIGRTELAALARSMSTTRLVGQGCNDSRAGRRGVQSSQVGRRRIAVKCASDNRGAASGWRFRPPAGERRRCP